MRLSLVSSLMALGLFLGNGASAQPANSSKPEAALTSFDQLATVRELDRQCRFLNFYERVDLARLFSEAAKSTPEFAAWVSAGMSGAATATFDAAQQARHEAASTRADEIGCSGDKAVAAVNPVRLSISQGIATALRHPVFLQELKTYAEDSPLRLSVAQAILTKTVNQFGASSDTFLVQIDTQIQNSISAGLIPNRNGFNRMFRFVNAGINQGAAANRGYQFIHLPDAEPGAYSFDWLRLSDQKTGGTRVELADRIINDIDGDGNRVRRPATGLEGLTEDNRIILMVNSAVEEGGLPQNLQATILYQMYEAGDNNWYDGRWRAGTSKAPGERLSDEDCPAEICFVFPEDVANNITSEFAQNRFLSSEVYISTITALPIPEESRAEDRDQLFSAGLMLKPD